MFLFIKATIWEVAEMDLRQPFAHLSVRCWIFFLFSKGDATLCTESCITMLGDAALNATEPIKGAVSDK